MLIAQVTDTHIKAEGRLAYGKVDSAEKLANCVVHLNNLDPQPDFVLMTGDLADMGHPEEYQVLRRLIAPFEMPVYVIPGNHDERGAFRRAFSDHSYLPQEGEFLHYVLEDYPLRFIVLDSTLPGEAGGALCPARLSWLEDRLMEDDGRQVVICMHHPPFLTGIAGMDAQNCRDGAALGALVERHPRVIRLLCGHVHRPIFLQWHGITASIAPSPSHSVAYDLRPGATHTLSLEPPSCQLHYWHPEDGLVSHLSFIGDPGGSHPFYDAEGRLID
jgi:Icc protein